MPNGNRISGDDEIPPEISLRWLNAFAAIDTDETLPTDKALEELHAALRSGQITARAIWDATGERRDMGADEWRGLVLNNPPRDDRVLIPYRGSATSLAKQADPRWKDVLLPRARLLATWPMGTLAQASQTNEATEAEQPEEAVARIGTSLNLQTSARHAPPAQVRDEGRRSSVAETDHPRFIPIEDRRRELIAARQTARVQRMYGPSRGKGSAPEEPSAYPVFLTSEDVIGWIAYRRTTALRHLGPVRQ